eukprot:scaffold26280_cov58-Phaeocystis_antarctica.AAC.7
MSGFFYDPAPGQMCELKRDVHSYDPTTRRWSERPPLPSCEAWGAGASVGSTLYSIGGSKFSRDARTFCFDNRVACVDYVKRGARRATGAENPSRYWLPRTTEVGGATALGTWVLAASPRVTTHRLLTRNVPQEKTTLHR